jgi:cytochrome c-type biogenesis protein CcmE
MSPTASRRLFLVGALAVAGAALGAISFGNIGENLVYYWDVSQLVENRAQAAGAVVRLGGQVKPGSVDWNAEENMLRFDISDGKQAVPVECTGAPPQMFREGIGVVVEGTVTATGVFSSDRLMVKHSNEYKAPDEEMSDAERKAMYDSVLEGDG